MTSQQDSFGYGLYGKFKLASMAVLLGLTFSVTSYANPNTATTIIADPSAPKNLQPTILPTASGLTQVNIQSPNDKGVSNNHYKQFDVGADGAILNNARKPVNTHLAGFVDGNPNMARGEARVILNQVNSTNPSHLNGFTEIAGGRAELIIANPAGIKVDGGGFINASGVKLSSSTPTLDDAGNLSINPNQARGAIEVAGKGLNSQEADYTTLIGDVIKINAAVHAGKELTTHHQTRLDVGNLGGMYAGRIHLVGTDKGLGVNNAGDISSGNTLRLDANGKLTNTGFIGAKADLSINTQNTTLTNKGTMVGANIDIQSKELTNEGHLSTTGILSTNKQDTLNNKGIISGGAVQIEAHSLDNTGRISQVGMGGLTLQANQVINKNKAWIGKLPSHKAIDLQQLTGSVSTISSGGSANTATNTIPTQSNTTSTVAPQSINVQGHIKADTINNDGQNAIIHANNGISFDSPSLVNENGAIVDVDSLDSVRSISNQGGQITVEHLNWQLNDFDNSHGSLTARESLIISSQKTINNENGVLTSLGELSLSANAINNKNGSIQGANTTLTANTINNDKGLVHGSNTLDISANQLSNTGEIYSTGTAKLNTKTLNNSGLVASQQQLQLNTTNLTNEGVIASGLQSDGRFTDAKHNLDIRAVNQLQSSGSILSSGNASIHADDMNLKNATLTAQSLDLYSQRNIDVRHATLSAKMDAKLTAGDGIEHHQGMLQAGNNIHLDTRHLDNTAGSILSGETLSIKAQQVNNQDGQIKSNKEAILQIDSSLNNTQGIISAHQNLNITSRQNTNELIIDNTKGSLSSAGNLTALSKSIKQAGKILANDKMDIKTSSLIQDGEIGANILTINNTGDFINNKDVIANQITINTTQNINNNQNIQANEFATIKASTISNASNAKIQANNINLDANVVTNDGSIEANQALNIKTQTLGNKGNIVADSNLGLVNINATKDIINTGLVNANQTILRTNTLKNTEKIYGGTVAIEATTLINGKDKTALLSDVDGGNNNAGVIASRANMNLAGLNITNEESALIYAGGDLAVGKTLDDKYHAQDKADLLTNASATINVMGDAKLGTVTTTNKNKYLTLGTQITEDPKETLLFSKRKDAEEYDSSVMKLWITYNQFNPDRSQWVYHDNVWDFSVFPDGTKNLYINWGVLFPDGDAPTNHFRKQFKTTHHKTVVLQSDPAKILVGGVLNFSDSLTNHDSTVIVGGDIISDKGIEVQNISTKGTHKEERVGWQEQYHIVRDDNGFFGDSRWESRTSNQEYKGEVERSLDLDTTVLLKNTNATQAQTVPQNTLDTPLSQLPSQNGIAGATINVDTPNAINTNIDSKTTTHIGSPVFVIPNNSLYKITPDTQANYLVETDPAFTNHKNWLSSDYMLSKLSINPDIKHKRLGDGFYEQRLVQDQIAHLTGHRFLGNYQDDESQFKALMDAGITFAQKAGIGLGTTLSEAQIASLTSDVILLTRQTMTMPDGSNQEVLVPKVYLAPNSNAQLRANGALIAAGGNIDLALTGNVNNLSGTIASKKVLKIDADNISNLAGNLKSTQIALNAQKNIKNIGGTLQADTLMSLKAGEDIEVASTISSNGAGTQVVLDRVAGLYVDDKAKAYLTLQAGKNINLVSANLKNSSDDGLTALSAGQDISMDVVHTKRSDRMYINEDNKREVVVTDAIHNDISSKSDIIIDAKKDITATGFNIVSDDAVAMQAGEDIRLSSSTSTEFVADNHSHTTGGFLSKGAVKDHLSIDSKSVNSSQLEGSSIELRSGDDTTLASTTAIADKQIRINAGGKVDVSASQNQVTTSHMRDEKKSGIFSTADASFTIGKKRDTNTTKTTSTSHTASQLGVLDGNILINASEYNQLGSHLVAHKGEDTNNSLVTDRGNIAISAKNINISNTSAQTEMVGETRSKQSGVTVSFSNSLIDSAKSIQKTAKAGREVQSDRMKAMAALTAASKAYDLGEGVGQLMQGGISPENLGTSRVQATVGSQSSKSSSYSLTGENEASTIKAAGNLYLIATGDDATAVNDGDITITGSNIDVTKNLYQSAGNVTYQAATGTSIQKEESSSKGWGAGVYAQISGGDASYGVTVNANKSKGNGITTQTTHANTTVNVGGATVNDIANDFTLDGANLNTKHLTGTVGGDLIVKSRQDTYEHHSKQKSISGSVDVGLSGGGSASLNYGKQNLDANYKAVTTQSGIKADTSDLVVEGQGKFTGGYLLTQDAQSNQTVFKQGIITEDIQNELSYKGKSIQVDIGASRSEGKNSASPSGLGYGEIDDHQTSTTHSAVTGQAGKVEATIASKDSLNEPLINHFDSTAANQELGFQVEITKAFNDERRKIRTEYAQQSEEHKKQAKQAREQGNIELAKDLETKASQIDNNLRLFDGITSALYAPNSNGIVGDVTRAISPQVAYRIGQYFKENELKNQLDGGNRPKEQSPQHLLAHAILGAATSYATGNDITSSALAGAGSEYTAPILATYLYGKDPQELSQEQKDTITSIISLGTASIAYGASDGDVGSAVNASEVGKGSVENNNYTWTAENFGMTVSDINHGIAKMERCQANPSASDCQPRKDYLGDYSRNVVNNATSGINTTASAEASGVALFGFSQSRGIATDIKGNTCTVDATCFLLGPRIGGSVSLNGEVATGNLTPGEKYYGVSVDGAIVPIAGAKGNVSLYSNGSVGYHGGASSGADFGLAIKVCSVQTEKECK